MMAARLVSLPFMISLLCFLLVPPGFPCLSAEPQFPGPRSLTGRVFHQGDLRFGRAQCPLIGGQAACVPRAFGVVQCLGGISAVSPARLLEEPEETHAVHPSFPGRPVSGTAI